jgi:hypothetical protein
MSPMDVVIAMLVGMWVFCMGMAIWTGVEMTMMLP